MRALLFWVTWCALHKGICCCCVIAFLPSQVKENAWVSGVFVRVFLTRVWLLKDFAVHMGTGICPSDVCDHHCEWGHWELVEILLSILILFAVGDKLARYFFAFFFFFNLQKQNPLVSATEIHINFVLDAVFQGLPGIWFMPMLWALQTQYVAMLLLLATPLPFLT